MKSKNDHQKYMLRALELACRGLGMVEPNPAVGCVIVKAGKIIGQGWHEKFGGPHAEINALADCVNNSFNPAGSVMYVTLEPCCHTGKTGPCTEAIITAKIAKVFVAVSDPFKKVSGRGIRQLRKAGIEVRTGPCAKEGKLLNAPFLKFAKTGRPWVILKWAQTIDGKMAYVKTNDSPRWISNKKSRADVHALRRQCQAILVGINTVIADDPLLTPRPSNGRKPLRIVLDSNLRIPLDCKLLNTPIFPVLIVTTRNALRAKRSKAEAIARKGVEIFTTKKVKDLCDLGGLMAELGNRGIQQLLLEAGPTVLASFFKAGLADAVRIYIAPVIAAKKGDIDITQSIAKLANLPKLSNVRITNIDGDICVAATLPGA